MSASEYDNNKKAKAGAKAKEAEKDTPQQEPHENKNGLAPSASNDHSSKHSKTNNSSLMKHTDHYMPDPKVASSEASATYNYT